MTIHWTDDLRPEFARALTDFSCRRLEPDRKGGWHALVDTAEGRGTRWIGLEADLVSPPRELCPLRDKRLSQIAPALAERFAMGDAVQQLAYKPGRRAVFVATSSTGTDRILKFYHRDRHLLDRWSSLREAPNLRTPTILNWDPERRILETEVVRGASFNERWRRSEGTVADGARLGQLLRSIWSVSPPANLPKHTALDEVSVLESRLPLLFETLASPPAAVAELTEEVCRALSDHTNSTEALCHRDLHDKQVFWDGERLSLIDLDLVALAPPALDAGNLLGHMKLRELNGASIDTDATGREFVNSIRAEQPLPDLHVWLAGTLCRLVLIYGRRHRSPGLLERLVASARSALHRESEWKWLP